VISVHRPAIDRDPSMDRTSRIPVTSAGASAVAASALISSGQ
jgi:hypothetical protein